MEYEILLLNILRDVSINRGFMDCIGQHSIASYIEEKGFKGKVYSGSVKDVKSIIDHEVTYRNIRIVGFYMAADNKRVVINIIKWIKNNFDVKVLVGGPEAAGVDERFFKSTGCDYAIVGEGEKPVLELLNYIVDGIGCEEEIGGLVYYNKNSVFCKNNLSEPIKDLDSIPYPKIENSLNKSFRKSEMVGIITGRGCPFHCSFCYEGANAKKVRFRSIENVMAEIDYISANNPNLTCINVYDDTFTLNFERVRQFCNEMKKRNLNWFCEGHINNIVNNREMIAMMAESGLAGMQLGIESGSETVLKAYNKNTTPKMIEEAVRICKEAGIICVSGNFIIGGAYESEETVKESMKLAKRLLEAGRGVFDCRTVFLAPYVNTSITNNPQSYGLKLDEEALSEQLTSMRSVVMQTNNLTTKQIERLKFEFDEMLSKEYARQAFNSNKNDVLSAFFFKGKYTKVSSLWQKYYAEIEHIDNFVKFYNEKDDILQYDKYIIRTAECFYNLKLSGVELEFLKHTNGRYNANEMLEVLGWSKYDFEQMYNNLRNKCLVYLSDF